MSSTAGDVPRDGGTAFQDQLKWALRLLWREKLIIAGIVLIFLALTLAYLSKATRLYTASASVVIDAIEASDTLIERESARYRLTEANVVTESEIIASTTLARRVIDRLGLENDPEFNLALRGEPTLAAQIFQTVHPRTWFPGWGGGESALENDPQLRQDIRNTRIVRRFMSRLSVKPLRRSFVVTIQYVSEDREKAALIANTIAELYVLERLEASLEQSRLTSAWLGERLQQLRMEVLAAEQAVVTYRAEQGLTRTGERGLTLSDQQLTELNSRLILARTDLAQKRARLAQAQALQRGRGVETATDVLQSPLIQRLREQQVSLERELSEALKTYGDRHPRIVAIRADLEEFAIRLRGEVDKIAVSLENEVLVAQAGVRTLEAELGGTRQVTDDSRQAEVRVRELERNAEASRLLYEAYLARYKRDAEQDRIQRSNARIVSPAVVPMVASSPASARILLLMLVLGLVVGTALIFLLDMLDGKIRSAEEAEHITHLPTFAMIPRVSGRNPQDALLSDPRSRFADGLRSLRNALLVGGTRESRKVIVVTSSVPEEGKSVLSLSLARLLAQSGEKVLLIDADLHRPRQQAMSGSGDVDGLIEVLRGERSPEQVIVTDPRTGLAMMTAGDVRKLGEHALNVPELVAQLRDSYDRILVDAPPVLAIADTRFLAKSADAVLYLMRWGSISRESVRNGIKILRDSGAPLIGSVITMVNTRRHLRYGYADYGAQYERYRAYYTR